MSLWRHGNVGNIDNFDLIINSFSIYLGLVPLNGILENYMSLVQCSLLSLVLGYSIGTSRSKNNHTENVEYGETKIQ